jgi:hypothetical protein
MRQTIRIDPIHGAMKSGEIKKIVQRFRPLFPSDWIYLKDSFGRRKGPWVQFIAFNPSRFSDQYEPQSCLDFLWKPGDMGGSMLGQGLLHKRHAVHRWVSLKEDPEAVYRDMVEQFRPRIDAPIDCQELKRLLLAEIHYWPHLYALFVLAAEAGEHAPANQYYRSLLDMLVQSPNSAWATDRRREIEAIRDMAHDSRALKEHLLQIEVKNLSDAKLLKVFEGPFV